MAALAVSYAAELCRFDIETTIIVPLMADVSQRLDEQAPPDVDVAAVAAAVVNAVTDRIRAEFLTRIGLQDLLRPHATHAAEVSRR
jgi:hypothetical protein